MGTSLGIIGVTYVYNGHVYFTLLKLHDNLIHLFHFSTVCVMNSRVSGQCSHAISQIMQSQILSNM